LVFDSKGAIYGTSYFGGNEGKHCSGGVGGTGCGAVFSLQVARDRGGAWSEKILHRFDGIDGSNPAAGVVFDKNGNLYGTTYFGPPNGYGLVFELKKPHGTVHAWMETVLHPFSNGSDGGNPVAGVVFAPNGSLYGVVSYGDVSRGDVFTMRPPSRNEPAWTLTVLYGFQGSPDGAQPAANLTFDKDGNFYSMTQNGGTGTACGFAGCGTVFRVWP
jgi:hypothetical protein